MTATRIPVTLITGFLGSGKTTLLQRIAENQAHRKLLFLVNEFAEQGIDPSLLNTTGVPVLSVVGGSLFCRCKVGAFIAHLTALIEACDTGHAPIEHLYIETSGLADPGAFHQLLKETRLNDRYEIHGIWAVVVPIRFLALRAMLPVICSQISAASLVLLNKMDLCSQKDIEEAEALIHTLNPHAEIQRVCYCDCLPNERASRMPTHLAGLTIKANPFKTRVLEPSQPVTLEILAQHLTALGDKLYRAKGFLRTHESPDHWSYFDWTPDAWSAKHVDVPCSHASIVLLFHESDASIASMVERLGFFLNQT
jgi:G3E family GTPase